MAAPPCSIRQYKLLKERELRIVVPAVASPWIRLVAGTAEIFGTELPTGNWIKLPSLHNLAIFSWNGATIDVDGTTEVEYIAEETPMKDYVNVHAILDARRTAAKATTASASAKAPKESQGTIAAAKAPKESQGPRVIIVGPTDSGKSSLSRMLLSWASKQGCKPTFVDLDIGQGSITIPGCIAATSVEMPIDPVEGIPLGMPIIYFFGHVTPSVNADFYKLLVPELARTVQQKFTGNDEARAAGMVINTMGWVEGLGYQLLLHAIDAFNVDVVLVLGEEKLHSKLKYALKRKANVDVVKLDRSGGVVSRKKEFRKLVRSCTIRRYFYGIWNNLSPYSNVVNFNDLTVFRLGSGSQVAPRSARRLAPTSIGLDMLHQVLGVSYAKEPEQVLSSNVAGFVYITHIDMQRKEITYVARCSADLPSRFLLAGAIDMV